MPCGSGGSQRAWLSNPRLLRLAVGTWNVSSLMGKDSQLVRELERCWLDRVGLTATHSSGSGTNLLERAWTFIFAGVVPGERRAYS